MHVSDICWIQEKYHLLSACRLLIKTTTTLQPLNMVANITAPFASGLANRYGHRRVVMTGGLLAGLGLSISYFANGVGFLFFSYGIVFGKYAYFI